MRFKGADSSSWLQAFQDPQGNAEIRADTVMRAMSAGVEIRSYEESDLEAIVEFSLRAWEPVFESLRQVLGEPIFARLHQPSWRAAQAEAVRSSCTSPEREVFVAVADGRPAGFAAVALNAFHERMGLVDIIAVDPAYQRRGIAKQLMDRSVAHMRAQGMDIAAVGTGGDQGHGPARALYESLGYTALPGVRYLKLLD
jgi:GNAT superfamily N-acetyltransferase